MKFHIVLYSRQKAWQAYRNAYKKKEDVFLIRVTPKSILQNVRGLTGHEKIREGDGFWAAIL